MAIIIDNPDELADEIINVLYGRKGFDDWWDMVDFETKNEILYELTKTIHDY